MAMQERDPEDVLVAVCVVGVSQPDDSGDGHADRNLSDLCARIGSFIGEIVGRRNTTVRKAYLIAAGLIRKTIPPCADGKIVGTGAGRRKIERRAVIGKVARG